MRKSYQRQLPAIGDLVVQKYLGSRYIGIIVEIKKDLYGHQKNVHIQWANKAPSNYSLEHGYHGANMENCEELTIIRRDSST